MDVCYAGVANIADGVGGFCWNEFIDADKQSDGESDINASSFNLSGIFVDEPDKSLSTN